MYCSVQRKHLHIRIVDCTACLLEVTQNRGTFVGMLEEVCHFPVNLVSKGTEVLGERVKYIYEEKGHTMRFRKKNLEGN